MKSYHQLLLNDSRFASDVAEILYPVAGYGPVGEARAVFERCKDLAHELIYARLDFAAFKNDEGDFLNVVPQGLGLDIREKVENEYQTFLDALDMAGMVAGAESEVLERVEEYAWLNGVNVLPEALEMMASNLSRCAGEYDRMTGQVEDKALMASYQRAMNNSLLERVTGTNSDDVLLYRQDMIEYLEKVCDVRMCRYFERFFSILASSSVFVDLKRKLEGIMTYLLESGIDEEVPSDALNDCKGAPGVVFTDLREKDPVKALKEYARILTDNQ